MGSRRVPRGSNSSLEQRCLNIERNPLRSRDPVFSRDNLGSLELRCGTARRSCDVRSCALASVGADPNPAQSSGPCSWAARETLAERLGAPVGQKEASGLTAAGPFAYHRVPSGAGRRRRAARRPPLWRLSGGVSGGKPVISRSQLKLSTKGESEPPEERHRSRAARRALGGSPVAISIRCRRE